MLLLLLLSHVSRVRLCATPQTAAHQAPLPMGFSRQGYWGGVPLSSPVISNNGVFKSRLFPGEMSGEISLEMRHLSWDLDVRGCSLGKSEGNSTTGRGTANSKSLWWQRAWCFQRANMETNWAIKSAGLGCVQQHCHTQEGSSSYSEWICTTEIKYRDQICAESFAGQAGPVTHPQLSL